MYEFLRGRVSSKSPTEIILEVGGVGYHLEVSLRTSSQVSARTEGEVQLYLHHRIQDDRARLFGFVDQKERELFRALLGISGIGPGHALSLLSGHEPNELWRLIAERKTKTIAQVRGVGPKTAERVCVDLAAAAKKRMVLMPTESAGSEDANCPTGDLADDAAAALLVLGYSAPQAEKAIAKVFKANPDQHDVQEIVRLALRMGS